MVRDIYAGYRNACLMVFRRAGDQVTYLATAVLVHGDGYLLTAAHPLGEHDGLVVAPWDPQEDFSPARLRTVAPEPVERVATDAEHDLALLRVRRDLEISVPDHILGNPEEVHVGTEVATLGYAFGFERIHNLIVQHAVVSARMAARNGTHLLLFDTMIHIGSRGGPLVNVQDGRIIGIIGDRFDPAETSWARGQEAALPNTNLSYAIGIDHGKDLLAEAGVSA